LKSAHTILVGTPEGKTQLERPNHRREYSIKMDLNDIGWDYMNYICMDQGRLM
jgi:hypothetical protein